MGPPNILKRLPARCHGIRDQSPVPMRASLLTQRPGRPGTREGGPGADRQVSRGGDPVPRRGHEGAAGSATAGSTLGTQTLALAWGCWGRPPGERRPRDEGKRGSAPSPYLQQVAVPQRNPADGADAVRPDTKSALRASRPQLAAVGQRGPARPRLENVRDPPPRRPPRDGPRLRPAPPRPRTPPARARLEDFAPLQD